MKSFCDMLHFYCATNATNGWYLLVLVLLDVSWFGLVRQFVSDPQQQRLPQYARWGGVQHALKLVQIKWSQTCCQALRRSMLKLALKKLWRQFGRTQGELKTSLQVEGMASLWELLGGSGKDNVLYIDALPCCKHALQDGMNMRKPRCDAWFPRSFFIVLI